MKCQKTAYKFALTAVFFWSTVASAFKIALSYLNTTQLVLFSSLSSLIVLLMIILYKRKIDEVINHIKTRWKTVLVLSLISPFLYYIILFQAYNILPAQEAQSINYTWALMLAFLSAIFLKQKLTLSDIVAGIICYFGVLIIATRGEPFSLNFSNINGVFLALLSTVLWSMYWIINTKVKVDPLIGIFSNFLFSVPIILTYAYFDGSLNSFPNVKGIFASCYIGIFEMGITFLFWQNAMQYAQSTSKIANLIFIAPFLSLVFIYFILGEEIYYSTAFGLVIIIFGLALQQSKKKPV